MSKTTPQLEDGYVRFAIEWLEEFVRADYPGATKEFVLVIARETWGWNTTWRAIPAPRIAELLGVTVARVKQLRDHAVSRNLIEWEPGKGHGDCGRYRVQKNYNDWIPQRVTGEWKRRFGQAGSGKDVLSGEDALSGNDALTASSKDALSGIRQERPCHLKDKDRHSIENDSAPPTGDADLEDPFGEDLTLAAPPEPEPKDPPKRTRKKCDRDIAFEACLTACGVDPASLDSSAYAKYAKAMGALVAMTSIEELQSWAEYAQAEGGRVLGTGAKPEVKVPALVRREITADTYAETFAAARDKQKTRGQRFIDNPTRGRIYERDWSEGDKLTVEQYQAHGMWDAKRGMATDDPRHPNRQRGAA